jgi:hypothetical protein
LGSKSLGFFISHHLAGCIFALLCYLLQMLSCLHHCIYALLVQILLGLVCLFLYLVPLNAMCYNMCTLDMLLCYRFLLCCYSRNVWGMPLSCLVCVQIHTYSFRIQMLPLLSMEYQWHILCCAQCCSLSCLWQLECSWLPPDAVCSLSS